VGRPFLYGLGAGGRRGVSKAIDILRSELDVTMALCGERDIKNVGTHNLLDAGLAPFQAPGSKASSVAPGAAKTKTIAARRRKPAAAAR